MGQIVLLKIKDMENTKKQTIREYLIDITERFSGTDSRINAILNNCEIAAKSGAETYSAIVHTKNLDHVVDYLVTVAKLDVVLNDNLPNTTVLTVSWPKK